MTTFAQAKCITMTRQVTSETIGPPELSLDLNQHVRQHPAATYYLRVQGDSMMQLGIFDADLLVVDRTLEPAHGDVVIAELDGEPICKVLDLHFQQLLSGNDAYPSISLRDIPSLAIAGVVTHSLRYHREYPESDDKFSMFEPSVKPYHAIRRDEL